jgi:hypothetical protein
MVEEDLAFSAVNIKILDFSASVALDPKLQAETTCEGHATRAQVRGKGPGRMMWHSCVNGKLQETWERGHHNRVTGKHQYFARPECAWIGWCV